MILVLCEPQDLPALWAYEGLLQRIPTQLELITSTMLSAARRWRHSVGSGGATVEVTLSDGRRIDGSQVHGALNRLLWLGGPLPGPSSKEDREYAQQEFMAFLLSWLNCLPGPMFNRPTPQGLSGCWRHPTEWAMLAARAGLPTMPLRLSSRSRKTQLDFHRYPGQRTVVLLDGVILGEGLDAGLDAACQRLALLAATSLLGIDLVPIPHGWCFSGATPYPDLRFGGNTFLDTLAAKLASP